MLRQVKRVAFAAARFSGLFALVARSHWRQQQLLILCYHGVSLDDEHLWNGTLYVSAELLRERCALLRDGGYTVLPLDEGFQRLRDGTLPPRSVVLTFDDGGHDFAVRAVPILKEFGFHATVYVATYYMRFQRPVFDPLIPYLAWKGRNSQRCDAAGLATGDAPLVIGTPAERAATVNRLYATAREKGLSAEGKDKLARAFADRIGVDYEALLKRRVLHVMTAEELESLPCDLIDVQLHTHRHRTPVDPELFTREIVDNRRELTAVLGKSRPLRHFCYPSGRYDTRFLPWLQAAGIWTATTCEPGLARTTDDPFLLPRFVDTMAQSSLFFTAWTSGLAELLPHRARGGGRTGDRSVRDLLRGSA